MGASDGSSGGSIGFLTCKSAVLSGGIFVHGGFVFSPGCSQIRSGQGIRERVPPCRGSVGERAAGASTEADIPAAMRARRILSGDREGGRPFVIEVRELRTGFLHAPGR